MTRQFLCACSAVIVGLVAWSDPALAQKTAKACRDEWRADKAAMQANGKTEKAYIAECTGKNPVTQPTAAPAATTPTDRRPPASSTTVPRQPPAAGRTSGAGEFASEAQAKASCPADTVVWVNLPRKIYHFSGHKAYGTTKNGTYMCEKDTARAGFRAAKNEKHP